MAGIYKAYAGRVTAGNTANGTVVIDNTVVIKETAPEPVAVPAQDAQAEEQTVISPEEQRRREQEKLLQDRMDAEIERVKAFYKEEGEKALTEAKQKAQSILQLTEKQAQEYADEAKKQAEEIFAKAREDGFAQGLDDGYKKGLIKCKDMLLDIKSVSERIVAERADLFDDYEAEIFDTVMEIANRVTLNSLNQKDKAVVRKIVKEAGKSFRGNDYVKLTLSGTDICEEMPADAEFFKKLFNGVKTIEIDVLKDMPSGTVIIDNGSEITDAGVMTQLKMIEELGRGKYRRAPSKRRKKEQEAPDTAQAEESAPEAVEAAVQTDADTTENVQTAENE